MNIFFTDLKIAISEVSKKVPLGKKKEDLSEQELLERNRLNLLKLIQSYVESGVWSGSKHVTEFTKNYKLTYSEYAKKTKKRESTVRQIFSRNSTLIRNKLGSNIIDRVLLADKSEINDLAFMIKTITASETLITKFSSDVLQYEDTSTAVNDYSVKELRSEIVFLKLYSIVFMDALYKKLNRDKLAYAIKLLRGELGDSLKQAEMYKSIVRSKSTNLLVDIIKSINPDDTNKTLILLDALIKTKSSELKGK